MSGWLWAAVVLVVLVVGWLTVLCATRVRRLDRLHARTDAARAGLESALERRAVAALAVAAALEAGTAGNGSGTGSGNGVGNDTAGGAERAALLRAAVAVTQSARASDADRETAENALGRALAGVDRSRLPAAVLEELVDAEQLLVVARRVLNDAVRDTRALRSRRMVRWLRLAGRAPMPEYFEIADPEFVVTELARSPLGTAPPVTSPTSASEEAS
jgi:hypothetical protein